MSRIPDTEARAMGAAIRQLVAREIAAHAEHDDALRSIVGDLLSRVEAVERRLGVEPYAPKPRASNVARLAPHAHPRTPRR